MNEHERLTIARQRLALAKALRPWFPRPAHAAAENLVACVERAERALQRRPTVVQLVRRQEFVMRYADYAEMQR